MSETLYDIASLLQKLFFIFLRPLEKIANKTTRFVDNSATLFAELPPRDVAGDGVLEGVFSRVGGEVEEEGGGSFGELLVGQAGGV